MSDSTFNGISTPKEICLFSPIRTGSTLVYNVLKDIFHNSEIVKLHQIDASCCDDNPVVVTYRNPLDSLASSIQRYGLTSTPETIKDQIKELKSHGLDDLLKIFNHSKILFLKYEDFYQNLNVVFSAVESYFNIKIPSTSRAEITDRYKIEKVEKRIEGMSDFSEYDKKDHWHGKHISAFKGRPNYYLKYFTQTQLRYIKTELQVYLAELGYN